jgi:hypothetical protein
MNATGNFVADTFAHAADRHLLAALAISSAAPACAAAKFMYANLLLRPSLPSTPRQTLS